MNQRDIPAIGRIVEMLLERSPQSTALARPILVQLVRECVTSFRDRIAQNDDLRLDALLSEIVDRVRAYHQQKLHRLINATGILLHTNLGRAPMAAEATVAAAKIGAGYCNIEYDLAKGQRSHRGEAVCRMLALLSGSEDAIVVNNGAAAIYLVLRSIANGGEVILSRGEMVQIGGGFRIPDMLRESGARLVEVGCTNITTIADYESAMTDQTRILLVVHQSNFAISGHCAKPTLRALSELARKHQLPLVYDLGSGALATWPGRRPEDEPLVSEALAQGADIVVFSGDKLLGGPQAGIICAAKRWTSALRKHPMARLLRLCKLNLAALDASLELYLQGTYKSDIPIQRMLNTELSEIEQRAQRLMERCREQGIALSLSTGVSQIGGGTSPLATLPTCLLMLHVDESFAERLRMGPVPVLVRLSQAQIVIDLRSVAPEEDDILFQQLVYAWKKLQASLTEDEPALVRIHGAVPRTNCK